MIFVTTGTQLPFPRLIAAMDDWAANASEDVVAQVGPDDTARAHLDVRAHLKPAEFEALFSQARLIVAHAGIGSILTAKRLGKPLILAPRRFEQGEHRNDHQMATAREVSGYQGLYVAWEMADLPALLARQDLLTPTSEISEKAAALHAFLKTFIDS